MKNRCKFWESLYSILICLSLLTPATNSWSQIKIWDFNTPVPVPTSWLNDSQLNTSTDCYNPLPQSDALNTSSKVEGFTLGGMSGTGMRLQTKKGTQQRQKIASNEKFTVGTYSWTVWIPRFRPDEKCGVGAFLYFDDNHEIDFEIGYGTPYERSTISPPPPKDSPIAFLNIHNPVNDVKLKFIPNLNLGEEHIKPGRWYNLSMEVKEQANKFIVDWYIQESYGIRMHAAHSSGAEFGSGSIGSGFSIDCSLENICQYGDKPTTVDYFTYFDQVSWTDIVDLVELSIRPWWQDANSLPLTVWEDDSPPIVYVQSALDNTIEVNPFKGPFNKLRLRITNLGDMSLPSMQNINYTVWYAPIFPGSDQLTVSLNEIDYGTFSTINALEPFGEITIPINPNYDWDITNPRGGPPTGWPTSPSAWDPIEKIYVKVIIGTGWDIDASNNAAQRIFELVDY